jgi:hypothetical protein
VHHAARVCALFPMGSRRIAPALLAGLSWLLPGCLITSNKDYQDETCPVSLVTYVEPTPQGVTHITSDGTSSLSFDGSVQVATCSIGEDLQAIVLVDQLVQQNFTVPATGNLTRTVPALVPLAGVLDGCHRIDIEVSHRFTGFFTPALRADDVAKATWWIDLSPKGSSAPILDCPGAQ